MQIALTLLISAMQLLTMLQGANVPQSFRDNAISIANQAITIAQEEILKQNQTTETPVTMTPATPQEPIIIYQPNPQPIPIGATQMESKKELIVNLVETPIEEGKVANFTFGAKNDEGKLFNWYNPEFLSQTPDINVDVKLNGKDFQSFSINDPLKNKWYTNRNSYNPILTEKGTYLFTFTLGNLTKTFSVVVE